MVAFFADYRHSQFRWCPQAEMDRLLAEVAISHLLKAFQTGVVYFPPMARLQVMDGFFTA